MARYQYETSPRKIEPEYRKRTNVKTKKKVNKVKKVEIKEQKKVVPILKVLGIFVILLTISYRNSLINEKFTDIKEMKSELALIEKENEQLEVNIESQMNLTNIEQKAKDELGMHKQTKDQTRYVNIEKTDFIESASEEVAIEKSESFFGKMFKLITNL